MAFETPITIQEAIENINRSKYLLPAIQREFVWNADKIERLFDSLMRDYPIGSFLFWEILEGNKDNFQFYEFIRNYHERDRRHNDPANLNGVGDLYGILDGQQRLTALYIGLQGSYAYKLPRYRWDSPWAFPERKLYLNLLEESSDSDLEYDFQFLPQEQAEKRDESHHWFEVGKILDLNEQYEVNEYLLDHELMNSSNGKFANRTLFKLHGKIFQAPVINYYLEKDETLDKVLNIFIRVNSGGTPLSYSDLLLSIATAEWTEEETNARQVITTFVDDINRIGDDFNFNKDFVLKNTLVLNDFSDIAFKVDNFRQGNMKTIEENWERVSKAVSLAVELISSFGYSRETLTANNAVIPIAYYILKLDNPSNFVTHSHYFEDRKNIREWLTKSLLKRVFSSGADTVLRKIREIINESQSGFPLDEIKKWFKGSTKSLSFTDEEIDHLFSYRYGRNYTFGALTLLYPTLDFSSQKFHQDHMFPKSSFKSRRTLLNLGISEDRINYYLDNYNELANLQLLPGTQNQEKSDKDFNAWLEETYPDDASRKQFMERHYIPDIDFSFSNFEQFIEERTRLMTEKYKSILQ